MVKLLAILFRLMESLLLAIGILGMIVLYQHGGVPLMLAGALVVYAILGAVYLATGIVLNDLLAFCLRIRQRRDRRRRARLQADIDAGVYQDIQPGTPWQRTRFGNSIAH